MQIAKVPHRYVVLTMHVNNTPFLRFTPLWPLRRRRRRYFIFRRFDVISPLLIFFIYFLHFRGRQRVTVTRQACATATSPRQPQGERVRTRKWGQAKVLAQAGSHTFPLIDAAAFIIRHLHLRHYFGFFATADYFFIFDVCTRSAMLPLSRRLILPPPPFLLMILLRCQE